MKRWKVYLLLQFPIGIQLITHESTKNQFVRSDLILFVSVFGFHLIHTTHFNSVYVHLKHGSN